MQLFTYVRQCLATEMRLVQAAGGESFTGLPLISSTSAEVLHKIDVLRGRTQVNNQVLNIILLLTLQ